MGKIIPHFFNHATPQKTLSPEAFLLFPPGLATFQNHGQ